MASSPRGFVVLTCILFGATSSVAGTIMAWGLNTDGQCDVPPPSTGYMAVAGGLYHSLGLRMDGSLAAWGHNVHGQCNVPLPNNDFVGVWAGFFHSLGLRASGELAAWGQNSAGQCNVPPPNSGFIAAAGGNAHSLGLKADGSIVAWGINTWGQCNIPPPNSDYVAVAAAADISMALRADGSVVAWGHLDQCQGCVPAPNSGFTAISIGHTGTPILGLRSDGSIAAWGGGNQYGQLDVPVPNQDFMAVAAGLFGGLGLKTDGTLVGWGDQTNGLFDVPAPDPCRLFTGVAAGFAHILAVAELDDSPGLLEVIPQAMSIDCVGGQLPSQSTLVVQVANLGCESCQGVHVAVETPPGGGLIHGENVYPLGTLSPGGQVELAIPLDLTGLCDTYGLFTVHVLSSNCPPTGIAGELWIPCCEEEPVGADEQPLTFTLDAAWPNPFNPTTSISFTMAETGPATLTVHNLAGAPVAVLWQGLAARGAHDVVFDAGGLPSGVYLYTLATTWGRQSRKLLLVR
jgi:hypothetical protein